jgi:hypothetical protein
MGLLQINDPNLESQAKKRRGKRLIDRHRRGWFATTEIKTGDPVGMIEPQFQAPLIPPQVYLRLYPEAASRPNDLIIDYDRWIADNMRARKARLDKAREIARKHFVDAYDPNKPIATWILDLVEPEPEPLEPIIAAKQGNRYVLGLTKRVDERLAHFFAPKESPMDADLARYDFRDAPDASAEGVEGDEDEGFDPVVDDELEAELDEADALEAQFDREHIGGQRVPVATTPKGRAPRAPHDTAHEQEHERPRGRGRGKRSQTPAGAGASPE